MKLYGSYTSPFVRHVRIVLLETNCKCEFIETLPDKSATLSPTKKVPYLEDGPLQLSDSLAILRYLREKNGRVFLERIESLEQYCFITTLLDSSANVFFLEMDGIHEQTSKYLARQKARIVDGLRYLENQDLDVDSVDQDVKLKLGCFLDWGVYRKRFSLEGFPALANFRAHCRDLDTFKKTAPPES